MTRLTDERTVELLEAGDMEELLQAATAHRDAFPDEMLGHYLMGRALFMMERDAEAQASLTEAIAREQNDRPYFWRGLSRQQTGDDDGAREDFQRAFDLDPAAPHYGYELGRQLASQSDFAGGRAVLERTVAENPQYVPALYTLGNVLADLNEHEAAADRWRDVVLLEPGHIDAAYNLGVYHQNRAEFPAATGAFQIAAETGDPAALAKVVQVLHQQELYDDAQLWWERTAEACTAAGRADFCIDQFPAEGGVFVAYRKLDQEEHEPRREIVFHFVVSGQIQKAINLESSAYGRETGHPYLLGEDRPDGHATYAAGWTSWPRYIDLKTAVIAAHDGQIDVVATSSTN